MRVIGLFGDEYDKCVGLLKRRIEDLGHKAIIINLKLLPRVTRATLNYKKTICDNYNLFEMSSFYLKEMEIRDPFFHVKYTKNLWTTLRERYLSFEADEINNVLFERNLLEILALKKSVINPPGVYSHRLLRPFHLCFLSQKGFSIPPFIAGVKEDLEIRRFQEESPLNLDEERIWDVLSFPKGKERTLGIRRKRIEGTTYKTMVLGDELLEETVAFSSDRREPRKIRQNKLPRGVKETALKAAKTIGAGFAEVDLQYSKEDKKIWLLQVDPSPDFYKLEENYGMPISESLARYLVEIAG